MIAIPDTMRRPAEVERDELRAIINDHIEREAAVCPEDVPFDEYIHALERQLTEARADADHWKGECSDLVRMAHEMRAEIDYFQTLIDLQHKRTAEADKLWQQAHNQPDVLPDLGRLIEWLMKRADDMRCDMRCCYNCRYGPMCSVDARVCGGCSFAHNNPSDGQMRWEAKL